MCNYDKHSGPQFGTAPQAFRGTLVHHYGGGMPYFRIHHTIALESLRLT